MLIHSLFFPHQTLPEIRKMQNAIGLSAGKASQRDYIKKSFIPYFEQAHAKFTGNLKVWPQLSFKWGDSGESGFTVMYTLTV